MHTGGRKVAVLVIGASVVAFGVALLFVPKTTNLGLLTVLFLILGAEFVNGWTDAPNAIAKVVGTCSLSPGAALALAYVFNLIGVMSGTADATTIGTGTAIGGWEIIRTLGRRITTLKTHDGFAAELAAAGTISWLPDSVSRSARPTRSRHRSWGSGRFAGLARYAGV